MSDTKLDMEKLRYELLFFNLQAILREKLPLVPMQKHQSDALTEGIDFFKQLLLAHQAIGWAGKNQQKIPKYSLYHFSLLPKIISLCKDCQDQIQPLIEPDENMEERFPFLLKKIQRHLREIQRGLTKNPQVLQALGVLIGTIKDYFTPHHQFESVVELKEY